jgi:hypothetical protein
VLTIVKWPPSALGRRGRAGTRPAWSWGARSLGAWCRAKILSPRIRGTTNLHERESLLIFLALFLRLSRAGALDSKWEKPSGLDKIWTKPVMGLACLKSGPMCCNGSIDDEMQAYPSAPLFQRSKKKTSFKNYRIQRVKYQ